MGPSSFHHTPASHRLAPSQLSRAQWMSVALLAVGCAASGEPASRGVEDAPASQPSADTEPAAAQTVTAGPETASNEGEATAAPMQPPGELVLPPAESVEAPGSADNCVDVEAETRQEPVTLLISLDASSSMRGGYRWSLVTGALKSFFREPSSEGLSAALQLFPRRDNEGTVAGFTCSPESYVTPNVDLTTLPDVGILDRFIDNSVPVGATPTNAAIQGLATYADTLLAAGETTRVALVLVTDGLPSACRDSELENTVQATAAFVASISDRIPTYVIGVGTKIDELNRIAMAGGTDNAVIIDDTNGLSVNQEILERMNAIGLAEASCDVEIPEAPDGRVLNPLNVTTRVRTAIGSVLDVPYEPDCLTGEGWHYDNLDAPQAIQLCSRPCQALKEQHATMSIVFGCQVNEQIVK